jgi:hypothetical protein
LPVRDKRDVRWVRATAHLFFLISNTKENDIASRAATAQENAHFSVDDKNTFLSVPV